MLAANGLAPQHDQVYLRFLLKLGERIHNSKSDLYAEFERLLGELGIQIEFSNSEGSEIQGEQDVYQQAVYREDVQRREEQDVDITEGDEWTGNRRERRASFSGVFEADDESTREVRKRAGSRASESRLQDHSAGFGSRVFKTKETNGAAHGERPQQPTPRRPQSDAKGARNRVRNEVDNKIYDERSSGRPSKSNQLEPSKKRESKAHDKRVSRKSKEKRSGDIPIYEDSIDRANSSLGRHRDVQSEQQSERPASPPLNYQFSETQLIRDADIFSYFHVRPIARDILRKWAALGSTTRNKHEAMMSHAVNYDQNALVRQGFVRWRQLYLARKHEADTEAFFENLGHRAARARDVHLLTKAFEHWAQCAGDEAEKSAVARRHIVRLRYFNAWKEVTAVNELKVRRLCQQKFLDQWRRKLKAIHDNNQYAVILYQRNLVEKTYWSWFWNFCERRAPEWRNARLKQQYLLRWIITLRVRREQSVRVAASRQESVRQSLLSKWFDRARSTYLQHQQADTFRRQTLLKRALSTLQREATFAPRERRIKGLLNWRIASTALSTLRYRTNLYARATELNQQRTLRNTWTTWNDHLRIQTLQNQITDRLAVQALYKWVLAERAVLLTRLNKERTQERALTKLVQAQCSRDARLTLAHDQVVQTRNCHALSSVFSTWRAKRQRIARSNEKALSFLQPRATGRAMQRWHSAQARLEHLEQQRIEANFYFRATRTFRAWGAAVQQRKKEKRRDAYVAVRRMVKINLARRVLGTWREKARIVAEAEVIAEDIDAGRRTEGVRGLLLTWREKLTRLADMEDKAITTNVESLLRRALGTWLLRLQAQEENASTVDAILRRTQQKTAHDALKRLQFQAFKQGGREGAAERMFTSIEKRRMMGLLMGWAERAQQRRRGPGNEMEYRSGETRPLVAQTGNSSLLNPTRTPRLSRIRPDTGASRQPNTTSGFSLASPAVPPPSSLSQNHPSVPPPFAVQPPRSTLPTSSSSFRRPQPIPPRSGQGEQHSTRPPAPFTSPPFSTPVPVPIHPSTPSHRSAHPRDRALAFALATPHRQSQPPLGGAGPLPTQHSRRTPFNPTRSQLSSYTPATYAPYSSPPPTTTQIIHEEPSFSEEEEEEEPPDSDSPLSNRVEVGDVEGEVEGEVEAEERERGTARRPATTGRGVRFAHLLQQRSARGSDSTRRERERGQDVGGEVRRSLFPPRR